MEKRILWVHWGRTGGGPRFMAEIVRADEELNPSTCFSSYSQDAEIAPLLSHLGTASLVVHTYNNKVQFLLGICSWPWKAFRLRRFVRRYQIEEVVCVMEHLYQSILLPLSLPSKLRYTVFIHDGKNHPGESGLLKTIGRCLEYRRADRVVVFAKAVKGIVQRYFDGDVITLYHPSFGLEDIGVVSARSIPEKPTIGFFGRLENYKGLSNLLEAAHLARENRELDFNLKIVGQGPESELKFSEFGGEADWEVEWVSEDQVLDVINSFDVLILPYTEASQSGPLSFALALGIPTIATPVGGLPEQIGKAGLLSECCKPESIAKAIEEMLTNPGEYRQYSVEALRLAREERSWSSLVESIRAS